MANKQKEIVNVRKINKMRWITGLVMSSLVIAITVVTLTLNIIDYYQDSSPESGIGTLRMFTTISNVIAAVAAFMCLPFQIDGLKKDKYKLPSWIVILLYVGTVGVFLTFVVALTVISIVNGFVYSMFTRSNLFMHTITPIFITLLFTLILSDTKIKFRYSFLALVPVIIYMIIYAIMVFGTRIWRDHYQTNTYIPWPVTLIILLALSFGISQLLRFIHNLSNKYVTNSIRRYYLESSDYDFPRVSDAVMKLAEVESKFYSEGDDIYIPTDIISLLRERYTASIVPLDILYDIYLESYLKSINKKD